MSNYNTENTEKIEVPFDQEDIKYSPDNYENTVAEYNTSTEGFDSAPVNNLDENQQKRNKLFISCIKFFLQISRHLEIVHLWFQKAIASFLLVLVYLFFQM